MRLGVKFGDFETKEVNWYKPLDEFPQLIKYLGRNYEWVFYDRDTVGILDRILVYAELPKFDPNHGAECPVWNELFPVDPYGCVCGAKYSSFTWDHMRFCGKWQKW